MKRTSLLLLSLPFIILGLLVVATNGKANKNIRTGIVETASADIIDNSPQGEACEAGQGTSCD